MLRKPNLLLIGHSHLTAIEAGLHFRRSQDAEVGEAVFVQLLEKRYEPALIQQVGEAAGLNPEIGQDITLALSRLGEHTVVGVCLGGNEYHFIGMARPNPCYDFEHEAASQMSLTPGAQIVRREIVRSAIRHYATGALAFVAPLKQLLSQCKVALIESPPPIPNNDFLMTDKSPFFEYISKSGVMPPSVRYKLWRVQSEIFSEVAHNVGWTYLSAPTEAVDKDGFMLEKGWHPDGVHSTAWYGERVVEQLEALSA